MILDFHNASSREIIWTTSFFIAFLVSLISGIIVTYRYRKYRRPNTKGIRPNGAGIWIYRQNLLLYILLTIVTFVFTLVGWLYIQAPEPIRPQNQQNNEIISQVFITAAVVTGLYSLGNLWMIFKIDREIRKEFQRQQKEIHDLKNHTGSS